MGSTPVNEEKFDWRVYWHYAGEETEWRTSTLVRFGTDPKYAELAVIDAHRSGEVIIDRTEKL